MNPTRDLIDEGCDPSDLAEAQQIAPEFRLLNIIKALEGLVNGPAHPHRMDAIRSTVKQLGEEYRLYLDGQLEPIDPPTDEDPF